MTVFCPRPVCLAVLCAALAPGLAQDAADDGWLTVDRAIAIAIERNHDLAAARARSDAERAGARLARSGRGPRIDLDFAASRSTNPVTVFSQLLGQEEFAAANFDPATLNEPAALTHSVTRVSASQALWAGGALAARIDAADAALGIAEARLDRQRQRVVLDVVSAYAGAIHATARLDAARQARDAARLHVRIAGDLHGSGLAVLSDLLRARVRESETEEAVIVAESEVGVARAALNFVLGLGLDAPLALPSSLEEALSGAGAPDSADLAGLLETSRARRPDMLASSRAVDAARSGVAAAQAARRPTVEAGAQAEANADGWPGADGTNWTVVLGARVPLVRSGALRAGTRRADAELRAAEAARDGVARSIELDVRRAVARLDAARARVALTGATIEMAAESLRIVRDRYQEGLSTLADLLDAETSLADARTAALTARRDLLTARYALRFSVGTL